MNTLSNLLREVEIYRPQTFKNISLYPLISPSGGHDVDYALFSSDSDKKQVRISENLNSHGVSDLKVDNRGQRRYLILDGDELQAKQEAYICRVSVIVPAKIAINVPVYNMEMGRWIHESDMIQKSARTHFAKRTSNGARRDLHPESRSLKVTVPNKTKSQPTSKGKDKDKAYVQSKTKLREFLEKFVILPSQIGVVFVVNGKVVGAELYENETIFAFLLPNLIDCYAADAIKIRSRISKRNSDKAVEDFMSGLGSSRIKDSPTPGEGKDFRFDNRDVIGGALVVNDRIVHLCALPESTFVNTADYRGRRERMTARPL